MKRCWLLGILASLGLALCLPALAWSEDDKKKEDKPVKETPKDKPADPHAALIGKKAPDIAGDFAHNGKPVNMGDLKGKVVLLDFWAVWCGPCIATFPHLQEWHKNYKDKGLEIVGLTMYNFERNRHFGFDKAGGKLTRAENVTKEGEQQLIKDFAAHHKLEHLLQATPDADWKAMSKAYGVTGIPQAVLIDRQGKVRLVKVGAQPQNAEELAKMIKTLIAETP